ncbi:hypothetical protein LI90_1647 [Carbonactinospora thermoautotrophica]|uniref:Uncharacterized protein n=1 Tax=Carbonactinospora thermoautotrophica TaxID=1469144 RepID=A0A132MRX0_9ACTN|nr:hypothetical protein LI90_1647 [Carbonactinospora thermoautotrophica]
MASKSGAQPTMIGEQATQGLRRCAEPRDGGATEALGADTASPD